VRKHVARGAPISLQVDSKTITCFAGESLAVALLASGIDAFRCDREGLPRAPYCAMGVCFECLVADLARPDINWVRACLTPARDGQRIATLKRNDTDASDL
jgi:sarcosine oxidase subunit alpha